MILKVVVRDPSSPGNVFGSSPRGGVPGLGGLKKNSDTAILKGIMTNRSNSTNSVVTGNTGTSWRASPGTPGGINNAATTGPVGANALNGPASNARMRHRRYSDGDSLLMFMRRMQDKEDNDVSNNLTDADTNAISNVAQQGSRSPLPTFISPELPGKKEEGKKEEGKNEEGDKVLTANEIQNANVGDILEKLGNEMGSTTEGGDTTTAENVTSMTETGNEKIENRPTTAEAANASTTSNALASTPTQTNTSKAVTPEKLQKTNSNSTTEGSPKSPSQVSRSPNTQALNKTASQESAQSAQSRESGGAQSAQSQESREDHHSSAGSAGTAGTKNSNSSSDLTAASSKNENSITSGNQPSRPAFHSSILD
jgi:hypothetical protein